MRGGSNFNNREKCWMLADVAHALLRAVSRLFSTLVDAEKTWRRHECRRGSQECVRHVEMRWLFRDKHLVVHVFREDDGNGEEVIRIISAREANQRERRIYVQQAAQ